MLTADDVKALSKPFAREDHEFIREFVYITEEAIGKRLDEIDPSWSFELLHMTINGDQAVTTARLTIKGVSRDGVGQQKVNEKAGEAEKGSATDALKRCARLFGVGRYLLGAPVQGQFATWLAKLNGATNPLTQSVQRTATPIVGGMQQSDAKAMIDHWDAQGVTYTDLLEALGVNRFSEWTRGRVAADEAVKAWLAKTSKASA